MRISDWSSDVCSSDLTWLCSTPAWLASSVWGIGTARHAGPSFGSLQSDMIPTVRAKQLEDLAAGLRSLAAGLMASGHPIELTVHSPTAYPVGDRKSTRLNSSH